MRLRSRLALVLFSMFFAGCGGGGSSTSPIGSLPNTTQVASERSATSMSYAASSAAAMTALHPQSASPGSLAPPPMPQTAIQPSSAMSGAGTPGRTMTGGSLTWTQISGAASEAVYAPDGSIWALARIDELQADLDAWMREYNAERPHQGRWCYGKTPMQTFLDSLELAKEKLFAA
jgi:hypothetical protein